MSARWEETLDHQIDLLKSLHSEMGRRYVEGWAQSVKGETPDGQASGWTNKDGTPNRSLDPAAKAYAKALLGDLPDKLSAMVFNADPVYVDPDVMTIIEGASAGFEPEPLRPEDLITEAGFMWFPRPIRMPDIYGKVMTYRAVLWHPLVVRRERAGSIDGTGIYLSLFHSIDDPDDYADADAMAREIKAGRLLLAHVAPWEFGKGYEQTGNPASGLYGTAKIIQCAWRLMLQTLSVRTQERASGPFRKRWARADMPEKRVTVVRLRRPAQERDPDAEHRTVDWQSRWIVGGHWRNQWYASLGVHRQVWISPYAKGPEDKPLVLKKTRVFEWIR